MATLSELAGGRTKIRDHMNIVPTSTESVTFSGKKIQVFE